MFQLVYQDEQGEHRAEAALASTNPPKWRPLHHHYLHCHFGSCSPSRASWTRVQQDENLRETQQFCETQNCNFGAEVT